MEPVARHGARACAPRRICSPATSTRRLRCSRSRPRWRPRRRNTDAFVVSESELAVLAMDRGRWAEAAEHVERALAAIEEHRMHDYATSVLAFAAAARLAVHRGDLDGGGPPAHAGDAGPSVVHVRAAVPRRARCDCSWPRCTAPSATTTTARHLLREIDDILLHRPALGALVDEVVGASPDPHRRARRRERPAASPLTPAELRLLPVPADAPDDPRDRGAAVRLPQHRQLRGRLDLPEAGRLLTQRRGATGDGDRPARRVADDHPPDWCSNASSMSYPSASASFGAAATTQGSPTTGMTPTSTSTISAAVAPASTAASACAP